MRLAIALTLLMMALPVFACKCVVKGDLESIVRNELETAASIVEARVINAKVYKVRSDEGRVEEQLTEWVVTRVLKGAVAPGTRFHSKSIITCCLCGLKVSRGQEFLLFRRAIKYHDLSDCGNDIPLEKAGEHIALINQLLPEYSR